MTEWIDGVGDWGGGVIAADFLGHIKLKRCGKCISMVDVMGDWGGGVISRRFTQIYADFLYR